MKSAFSRALPALHGDSSSALHLLCPAPLSYHLHKIATKGGKKKGLKLRTSKTLFHEE